MNYELPELIKKQQKRFEKQKSRQRICFFLSIATISTALVLSVSLFGLSLGENEYITDDNIYLSFQLLLILISVIGIIMARLSCKKGKETMKMYYAYMYGLIVITVIIAIILLRIFTVQPANII